MLSKLSRIYRVGWMIRTSKLHVPLTYQLRCCHRPPSSRVLAMSTPTSATQPRRQESDTLSEIPDEAPPAYTPTPSFYGEQTVATGPARPFSTGPNLAPRPPVHPSVLSPSSYARPVSMPPSPQSHLSPPTASSTTAGYRPTTTPVPGQPLLNNGRLLVFPKDHYCEKCHLVGYRANDPSNPCKKVRGCYNTLSLSFSLILHCADERPLLPKCWSKHGRPYSSAMRIALESATTAPPNYQKPLPHLSSPRPPGPSSSSSFPGNQPRPLSYSSLSSQSTWPQSAAWMPPQSAPSAQPWNRPTVHLGYGIPPPGAIVVRPGDPRLGNARLVNCEDRSKLIHREMGTRRQTLLRLWRRWTRTGRVLYVGSSNLQPLPRVRPDFLGTHMYSCGLHNVVQS
jgi:hypothetical protein